MSFALRVQLVTPRGTVLDEKASSLTVGSELGEMCMLPGHCAILAALEPSRMIVELQSGTRRELLIDWGFLEGGAEHAQVVTERCVDVDKLDAEELRKRIEEIEKQLSPSANETLAHDGLVRELAYHRVGLGLLEQRR
ncbi:MAG: F0F1 ATP synthase subunit epsilon [Myxococcota bacterium]|jgi:F-type H+-transporting ATPase subunit epsilon|nr:F0F1 ATP synthase subunit epsilon [Myxococcota bacterium]